MNYLISILLALIPFSNAQALDTLDSGGETQGDMVLFPGNYFGPLVSHDNKDPNAGAPGSKAGWHIPGTGYRAGTGWWALVCETNERPSDNERGCKLYPTQLSVSKAKHAVYDAEPVNSQLLHWTPLPAYLDKVPLEDQKRPDLIALFKPIRTLAKLKFSPGSVATYVHRSMPAYPATPRIGTLEVRLSLGSGAFMDVVPRVRLPQTQTNAQSDEQPTYNPYDIDVFELRMGNQRQQLPGHTVEELEGGPLQNQQSYLLWAGDLDGDGKPDLILNHGGYGIHVALYLSSLAREGELVGLAGSFEYADPSSAGC